MEAPGQKSVVVSRLVSLCWSAYVPICGRVSVDALTTLRVTYLHGGGQMFVPLR